MKSIMLAAILILASSQVFAKQLSKENKLKEFMGLLGQIEANYGPLEYKQDIGQFDWELLQDQYIKKVLHSKNNVEYYYLVSEFFAKFNDGHFGVYIPTNSSAALNFALDYVDSQAIVVSSKNPKVSVGDIVLEVDGKPVYEVLKELSRYKSFGYKLSNLRLASWWLTGRHGSFIPAPKNPEITFTFKTVFGFKYTETFKWKFSGTPGDEIFESQNFLEKFWAYSDQAATGINDSVIAAEIKGESSKAAFTTFSKEELKSLYNTRKNQGLRSGACSYKSLISIPKNANVFPTPFTAYTWEVHGKTLGFIRLPHFTNSRNKVMSHYEYILNQMDKITDGLIIDQSQNCGGSVSEVHTFASFFIDRPIKPIPFRLLANKVNKMEWENLNKQARPFTFWFDITHKISKAITKAWTGGEFLTDKIFFGQEWIYPHPYVRYSKPVILLIDELAGSGGDAFPSLVQGAGIKVLGVRSGGLGGHVECCGVLPFSGILHSMTKSLFYRHDGVPIENNGTEPNIPYTIDALDYVSGLKMYREFYTQELLKVL